MTSPSTFKLSILVPVYNEDATLLQVMNALHATCEYAQIVYIDDGSSDNSYDILKKYARTQDIVLTQRNGGKGSAIRAGLAKAAGDFTVIQDADLEYDPKQIGLLLQATENRTDTVVFGSRFLTSNPNIYKRYLLGNKVITGLLNILFGSKLTDSYTCYKLLPTNVLRSLGLVSDGFEMEAEICAKCIQQGIPIKEIAISYNPRTLEEGKKIGWKDAWKGCITMLKVRFSKRVATTAEPQQ